MSLFESPQENPPLREALDFYRHAHGWSNRLVAGDSLLVMNSLLEKEGMAGKVQMVYLDPPYGIRYGSNFQPFVNKRDVNDGKDEDLTAEPEMIRAFRDTWELGIHSYLTYLRDRLLLARELLHESGSCMVQIGDENLHLVYALMSELFGSGNFAALISLRKTSAVSSPMARVNILGGVCDYVVWFARDIEKVKYRQLYFGKSLDTDIAGVYAWIELPNGERRRMTVGERTTGVLPAEAKVFRVDNFTSAGWSEELSKPFKIGGMTYEPGANRHWATHLEGRERLVVCDRLVPAGKSLGYVRYLGDFPVYPVVNNWIDTGTGSFTEAKVYVVQSGAKAVARCLLMTTDPGDLVFDPTCGSGTTAYVAEQWGRRWITCDTSRVAIALAKQRLMTALYDYYELAHPQEGVGSGFVYKTVPHVTLKSIANNPEIKEGMTRAQIDAAIAKYADQETLYDQPRVDKSRARVAGPFTVEAVPAPVVRPLDAASEPAARHAADASEARSGETLRHAEWREELLKTGIRGKSGQRILFSRVEPLAGTRWLHAEAETKPNEHGASRVADRVSEPGAAWAAQRVVIAFGPEHAPLEQKQVERAWQEAGSLAPKPALLVLAAFQFDPEAAKDIDELTPAKAGMTLLKVQMNPDLLTADLKKKRASNESFWLVGQPDVELRKIAKGEHAGLWQVEVRGFDYYNTKTGEIDSGSADRIAIWLLDPDYDDRSLFPRQVFFPMAGEGEGWARLARSLRAELDEERIEAYRGTVSLPFEAKRGQKVAVKVVDDRGIESLRIVEVE
jgi:adenine-specific DNA-methyltransferase